MFSSIPMAEPEKKEPHFQHVVTMVTNAIGSSL